MHSVGILKQNRKLIHRAVSTLASQEFMTIPPGFDNNIAWNLGHILVVQQLLHYKLSGLELYVTSEQVGMFKTGTSPADWSVEPDVEQLVGLLDTLAQRLDADYQEGKFRNFKPYTTSTGIHLTTLEDALTFNNFHEGLHFGFILALKNLVVPSA